MPTSGLHLVIGASGQVGGSLLIELERREIECIGTYSKNPPDDEALLHLDLTSKEEVEAVVQKLRPAQIYIPASYTNVDGCEENEALSRAVNVEGVQSVCAAADKVGSGIVYFSSDYVFDGKNGPYAEDAPTTPISVYGRHKVMAEETVLTRAGGASLVVRTTVVFGLERQQKNFVLRLVQSLSRGQEVPVPTDQIGSPTLNSALAESTVSLVQAGAGGVFNVAGEEICSRFDLAQAVADEFDLDMDLIVPVATAMLNQKAARPLQAGLKVDKVRQFLGPKARLTGYHRALTDLHLALEEMQGLGEME